MTDEAQAVSSTEMTQTRKVRCADHGTFEELAEYREIGNCPICQQPMHEVEVDREWKKAKQRMSGESA